jgi:peptidoglycan hydrolase CwlO-like protein
MSLNTTITLAGLFSFISMLGTLVAIYAIVHSTRRENTDKEVEIIKRFTTLEVKLDNFTSQVSSLNQNYVRSDEKLDQLQTEITKQNEKILTLFKLYENLKPRN